MTSPLRQYPAGGRPRPAGLDLKIERVSGAPICSMRALDICLTPALGPALAGAVVRVTMKEREKAETVYYLCHACAKASGDLRDLPGGGPAEKIAEARKRPSFAPPAPASPGTLAPVGACALGEDEEVELP